MCVTRSVSALTTTILCRPMAASSGWRTWWISPFESRNSNGSKGCRTSHSRTASAFIVGDITRAGLRTGSFHLGEAALATRNSTAQIRSRALGDLSRGSHRRPILHKCAPFSDRRTRRSTCFLRGHKKRSPFPFSWPAIARCLYRMICRHRSRDKITRSPSGVVTLNTRRRAIAHLPSASREGRQLPEHCVDADQARVEHGFAGADFGAGDDAFGSVASFDRRADCREVAVVAVGIAGEKGVRGRRAVAEGEAEFDEGFARDADERDLPVDQEGGDRTIERGREVAAVTLDDFGLQLAFQSGQ